MKMRSKMQNEKGFTLVELMVVVVILGILVAIAVPIYNNLTVNAAKSAHDANVRTLIGAATTAIATEGLPSTEVTWNKTNFVSTTGKHLAKAYLQEWPEIPDVLTFATTPTTYEVKLGADGKITCTPDIGAYTN